ncbi:unnamed protein product [Cuscuta campestris]|uniref:Uncharacterized protein n=1 Tax=Cuscuta campestris TaxID=132261 RepID=A0A484KM33_9ASTE|nr:unnamed protein product [Cuscuta campestris]
MGLEMLLPWTVEAEFGISCSFPLDATVMRGHGLCFGEMIGLEAETELWGTGLHQFAAGVAAVLGRKHC